MVMAVEAVEVMVVQVIEVAMEVPLVEVVRKKDTLKETVFRLKPLPLAEMETVSILMN